MDRFAWPPHHCDTKRFPGHRYECPKPAVSSEPRQAGSKRTSRSARSLPSGRAIGYFWIGAHASLKILLCESAIDAISCSAIDANRICISTSGARANPRWLKGLIDRGYRIHCGFDADEAGDNAASQMVALYPTVERLRPPAHDWNDALAEQR